MITAPGKSVNPVIQLIRHEMRGVFQRLAVLQKMVSYPDFVLRRLPAEKQAVAFNSRLDGDIHRRGYVLDSEGLNFAPPVGVLEPANGADFTGGSADWKIADI